MLFDVGEILVPKTEQASIFKKLKVKWSGDQMYDIEVLDSDQPKHVNRILVVLETWLHENFDREIQ